MGNCQYLTPAEITDALHFGPPVTHVYNPLVYAREPWDVYCERYGQGQREVLLVGLNPGPWGLSRADQGAAE